MAQHVGPSWADNDDFHRISSRGHIHPFHNDPRRRRDERVMRNGPSWWQVSDNEQQQHAIVQQQRPLSHNIHHQQHQHQQPLIHNGYHDWNTGRKNVGDNIPQKWKSREERNGMHHDYEQMNTSSRRQQSQLVESTSLYRRTHLHSNRGVPDGRHLYSDAPSDLSTAHGHYQQHHSSHGTGPYHRSTHTSAHPHPRSLTLTHPPIHGSPYHQSPSSSDAESSPAPWELKHTSHRLSPSSVESEGSSVVRAGPGLSQRLHSPEVEDSVALRDPRVKHHARSSHTVLSHPPPLIRNDRNTYGHAEHVSSGPLTHHPLSNDPDNSLPLDPRLRDTSAPAPPANQCRTHSPNYHSPSYNSPSYHSPNYHSPSYHSPSYNSTSTGTIQPSPDSRVSGQTQLSFISNHHTNAHLSHHEDIHQQQQQQQQQRQQQQQQQQQRQQQQRQRQQERQQQQQLHQQQQQSHHHRLSSQCLRENSLVNSSHKQARLSVTEQAPAPSQERVHSHSNGPTRQDSSVEHISRYRSVLVDKRREELPCSLVETTKRLIVEHNYSKHKDYIPLQTHHKPLPQQSPGSQLISLPSSQLTPLPTHEDNVSLTSPPLFDNNKLTVRSTAVLADTPIGSPPSLVGFNLLLDTESDSSDSSSSPLRRSTHGKENIWRPTSLMVSLPYHLLHQLPSPEEEPFSAPPTSEECSPASSPPPALANMDNSSAPRPRDLHSLYLFAQKGAPKRLRLNEGALREVQFIDETGDTQNKIGKVGGNREGSKVTELEAKSPQGNVGGRSSPRNVLPTRKTRKRRKGRRLSAYVNPYQANTKTNSGPKRNSPSARASISPASSDTTSITPPKKAGKFKDFVPVVLQTRSRAEAATLMRRKEQLDEMNQNEQDRINTALPGDHYAVEPGSELDDSSSILSVNSVSSRDRDSSIPSSSLTEEFSADVAERCKRLCSNKRLYGSGDTPLHKVCRTGRYEMVRYFIIAEKIDVNSQDHAGWAPLHEACNNGNIEIAQLLLQYGADPNPAASDGTRPIHDATEGGCLPLVKLLVKHGADPLAECGGKTPLEIAQSLGQDDIVEYLEGVLAEKAKQSQSSNKFDSPSSKKRQKRTVQPRVSAEVEIKLPVNGYNEDEPMFGEELDHPMYYIAPTVELSSEPFVPVYNLTIGQEPNSRRHNFYILSDVLKNCSFSKQQLIDHCCLKQTWHLTVPEFQKQLRLNPLNKFVQGSPAKIKSSGKPPSVEFVPLCRPLQLLLGNELANLDD